MVRLVAVLLITVCSVAQVVVTYIIIFAVYPFGHHSAVQVIVYDCHFIYHGDDQGEFVGVPVNINVK
jgi:hypothetical protein